MDLPKEVRDQIKAEEFFREEVKREIASLKTKSQYQRIWEVLNSQFSIWLLTSIVGTMFLSWYRLKEKEAQVEQEQRQQARIELNEKKQLAMQAEHELTFRVNEAELALKDYRDKIMARGEEKPEVPDTKTICEIILRKLHQSNHDKETSGASRNLYFSAPIESIIATLCDAKNITDEKRHQMTAALTGIRSHIGDATRLARTKAQEDLRYQRTLSYMIHQQLKELRTSNQPHMLFTTSVFSY